MSEEQDKVRWVVTIAKLSKGEYSNDYKALEIYSQTVDELNVLSIIEAVNEKAIIQREETLAPLSEPTVDF